MSNIVGSFKSAATKRINEIRTTPRAPVWQSRFYDHIIGNEKSLSRIREYIKANPQQWAWDKENAKCISMDKFDCWFREEEKERIPKGK